MKTQIFLILIACLILSSCNRNQPNGKYLITSGKINSYTTNPYFDEQASSMLKDQLIGKEFKIDFKDDIAILDGYQDKKIVLNADESYNRINPKMQLYKGETVTKGINSVFSLYTGIKTNSSDVKINLRRSFDNNYKDTAFVSDNHRNFAELSFTLKNLN